MDRQKQAQTSKDPDILAWLAKNEDPVVRRFVAVNEHTSPNILAQLAKDEDWDVRCHVAHNKSTPTNILVQLAQ